VADRATLHLKRIDAFAEWAGMNGYRREDTRGAYEVLKLRKKGSKPLIYYTRAGAKEHTTATDAGARLVWRWLIARKESRGAGEGK